MHHSHFFELLIFIIKITSGYSKFIITKPKQATNKHNITIIFVVIPFAFALFRAESERYDMTMTTFMPLGSSLHKERKRVDFHDIEMI